MNKTAEELIKDIKILTEAYSAMATEWAGLHGNDKDAMTKAMNIIATMRRCKMNTLLAMGKSLDYDLTSDGDDEEELEENL